MGINQLAPNPKRDEPTVKNHKGASGWEFSIEEKYRQLVFTNTVGNTYYMTSQELAEHTFEVQQAMLEHDPKRMAQIAVEARQDGFMRLQPIVSLVYLSTIDNKEYFETAFWSIIRTPNDLLDFVKLIRHGNIRGFGRAVRRTANHWLQSKFKASNQYWYMKYKSKNGFSIKDAIQLLHTDTTNHPLLHAYLDFGDVDMSQFETLKAAERVRELGNLVASKELNRVDTVNEIMDLVRTHRLDAQYVTSVCRMDTELWCALAEEMPYFQLLRHLNTLERNGVFDRVHTLSKIIATLQDSERRKAAKVLPFRLWQAYVRVSDTRVRTALVESLEGSVENLPEIHANVGVGVDTSGSMGDMNNAQSPIAIASILAMMVFKRVASPHQGVINAWGTNARPMRMTKHTTVLDGMEFIFNADVGYSTNAGASIRCFEHLQGKPENVVIVTDMEWNMLSGLHERGEAWNEYRKAVPNAKLYIVNVQATGHARMSPPDDLNVNYYHGWSDAVVKHIVQDINSR